ncbi:MAG: hypothetical protein HYV60_08295 [Planctomycetia bacterium]|nr:hypothetical protein [Planctomycetia bacterium]
MVDISQVRFYGARLLGLLANLRRSCREAGVKLEIYGERFSLLKRFGL